MKHIRQTCQTLTTFPLPELRRIIFGSKIKLCPTFIQGSWIDLPDRSTSLIGISSSQKTIIYSANQRSRFSKLIAMGEILSKIGPIALTTGLILSTLGLKLS